MALQTSGSISLSDINVELENSQTQIISLNDTRVRTLLNVSSGAISLNDAYGKSNRVQINYIISSNSQQLSLSPTTFTNYVAGKSDIIITVNSGVYVWSDSTSVAGLTINGGLNAGDTLKLVNNGYIIGKGGQGGDAINFPYYGPNAPAATSGGPALSIFNNITIDNLSYIAGGGGGGAGNRSLPESGVLCGGGGGAGGGNGGRGSNNGGFRQGTGGTGGSIGNSGGNGTRPAGGGGGRILPGTGGIATQNSAGQGGGAGGSGGSNFYPVGAGGSANNPGVSLPDFGAAVINGGAAGGGGWGASGGTTSFGGGLMSAGTGGKAINLNGYSVTYITTSNVWGAVS